MNRQDVVNYLKKRQKDLIDTECPDEMHRRYCNGYASGLYEARTLVKNMTLPSAIRAWLQKSGYPIVNMDQAVASVEKIILTKLEDIIEIIWDDVEGDPNFLRSCDFDT